MASSFRLTTKAAALSGAATIALTLGAQAAFADPFQFTVEDGVPLQTALNEFARAADTQILFSSDIVDGKMAPALSGSFEVDEGLTLLLADSGLDFSQTANGTLMVIQVSTQVPANTNTGPTGTGEPVSVEGTVRGAITDSNLKGARVEIVETGQTTATDDLGRFRFPAVAPGSYTLRISYLGRETIQETIDLTSGGDFSESFSMGFPSTIGVTSQVDVFGARSARAQALNQERTAPNSTTVLSADALGSFNGTTVSEALRRAPGIAFVPDDNTGDGANVIIRGLEPDLNQITLNGVRLIDGSGRGRSPNLAGILTESIESVTINKSLLPSQDSNGAGGLVEIETKSPLDRPRRFASFGLEYGENGGDFGDEFLANGTLSGTFGANDDFGMSLSASYRERDVTRLSYNIASNLVFGEYLPAGISTSSLIDPRDAFPFEDGGSLVYPTRVEADSGSTEDEVLSVTGSIEKQFEGHTNLRFDLSFTEQTQSIYNAQTIAAASFGFALEPIDALGGEERFAFASEDPFTGTGLEFLGVTGLSGDVQRSAAFAPDQESQTLNASFRGDTNFNDWDFGYNIGYTISEDNSPESYGISLATQASGTTGAFVPFPAIDEDFLTEDARNNRVDGRIVSIFAPLSPGRGDDFILPSFTPEAFAFFNDLDSLELDRLRLSPPSVGEAEAITLSGSARRSFNDSFFDYLEAGFNYQDTEFSSTSGLGRVATFQVPEDEFGEPLFLPSDLGLVFGPGLLTSVGAPADFNSLQRGSVESVFQRLGALEAAGLIGAIQDTDREIEDLAAATPGSEGTNTTSEETLAVYLEGKVTFDKLEVIGGVRIETLDLSSTYFAAPTVRTPAGNVDNFSQEFGQFVTDSTDQTDILPRFNVNYRFNDNSILRGSYFTTVSRPRLINLTSRQRLDLRISQAGPDSPEVYNLDVRQGNPDLEPATTHNFGLDWEYYTGDVGVIKISGFYKNIENPLQTTNDRGDLDILPEELVLPDIPFYNDLPADTSVVVRTPINGENDNTIWGVELTLERQFDFLPDFWSGFGILANYTYTESERDFITVFGGEQFIFEDVPFIDSPENSGTIGLTYSGFDVDASLLYSYQDRRVAGYERNFLNEYNEEIDSLDLRIDYLFDVADTKVRLFLRGNDLLKGDDDAALQQSIGGADGVAKYYTDATYFGGRSLFVGTSIVF